MSEGPARYCPRCLNSFREDLEQCPNLVCGRPRPSAGWGRMFGPGEIFDRSYLIERRLAQGGAGITYVARALDAEGEPAGDSLAIKVLLAARDQGPYVRRLATEAQIVQELAHPNIVQYLGFVHRPGTPPYLLTAFERGGSLYDHIVRVGPLPVRVAASIARQICWALEQAHKRGIIHRDLKPENVLLDAQVGREEVPGIRVADFGIAKVTGSLNSNLTRQGAFVGTPHYAAPEQFVGGRLTGATDIYAVGAILYFLMMGQHVLRFAHQLPPEDTFQLLCDSLPPRLDLPGEAAEDVAGLQAVLAASMAVEQRLRPDAAGLDRMLEAVTEGRVPQAPPPPPAPSDPLADAQLSLMGAEGAGMLGEGAAQLPRTGPASAALQAPSRSQEETLREAPPSRPGGGPAPTWGSLDGAPVPTPTPEPPAPRGGVLGGMVIGGGLFALVAAVVLVLGVGLAWWGGLFDPGPDPAFVGVTEITADTTSAEGAADWAALRDSLGALLPWLQRSCGVAAGERHSFDLVVEANGAVRAVQVTGGADHDHCLGEAVRLATFARAGTAPVRVQMAMTWREPAPL